MGNNTKEERMKLWDKKKIISKQKIQGKTKSKRTYTISTDCEPCQQSSLTIGFTNRAYPKYGFVTSKH